MKGEGRVNIGPLIEQPKRALTTKPPFEARMRSGITVELLGVSDNRSKKPSMVATGRLAAGQTAGRLSRAFGVNGSSTRLTSGRVFFVRAEHYQMAEPCGMNYEVTARRQ